MGTTTSACGLPGAGRSSKPGSPGATTCSSSGMPKPRVLPVPVLAWPMMSWPGHRDREGHRLDGERVGDPERRRAPRRSRGGRRGRRRSGERARGAGWSTTSSSDVSGMELWSLSVGLTRGHTRRTSFRTGAGRTAEHDVGSRSRNLRPCCVVQGRGRDDRSTVERGHPSRPPPVALRGERPCARPARLAGRAGPARQLRARRVSRLGATPSARRW